jgi:ATP-binding cassette subfamily B protein
MLYRLFRYLWVYRLRVVAALACLIGAKLATVSVPLVFKEIIDAPGGQQFGGRSFLALPLALVLLYGLLRFASSLCTELREIIFAKVTQQSIRQLALEVFEHLHALSLRFHLDRQTGGIARDIERGTHAIATLINYTLYSILPTLIEIGLVLLILALRYPPVFALITFISLLLYVVFTIMVSQWRIDIRRRVNETDSAANTRAIDSLINYETVKYFNNEPFETRRYDEDMARWATAATRSQISLSFLNLGQQAIVAAGLTLMMWQATKGVLEGQMSVGDLVLVNAFLMQLYMPLNFLGVVYREIRQAMTDIERLFGLLATDREIADAPDARPLQNARTAMSLRFENVSFSYDPGRAILKGVEFTIPAGHTVAVVGRSGAGKSTLARLLFRFYDTSDGRITIDGTDIRALTQSSLRAAQLDVFVAHLPAGYNTRVGERGLKLSGGEKQRVAIARSLLKNPAILVFDEATSALDSRTEQAIQQQLETAARGRTTLVIAHRLSTIMRADEILVMEEGRIVERGTHSRLLAQGGIYAQMWARQGTETGGARTTL